MKKEYSVIPKKSIGPIFLGMKREEVRAILGAPEYVEDAHEKWGIQFPDKDCFFESCLQVRYSEAKEVDDIQASASPEYIVTIGSISVHEATVSEVASAMEKLSPIDKEESEYPYVFAFPGIGVSFWREDCDQEYFDTINVTKPKSEQNAVGNE